MGKFLVIVVTMFVAMFAGQVLAADETQQVGGTPSTLAVVGVSGKTTSDMGIMVGKQCRGTYNTGMGREGSQGVVSVRFDPEEVELRVSSDWYLIRNPQVVIPADKAQKIKPMIAGTEVKFVTESAARWELVYSSADRKLSGSVDPRAGPGRAGWSVASVEMICEEVLVSNK